MSYDVWLVIDTGGPEPGHVGASHNMTWNVAPMWRLAGADVGEFHDRLAGDLLPDLDKAISEMETNPGPYEALNPGNGWGSYETCLGFLRNLRADFRAHPKATVKVWR